MATEKKKEVLVIGSTGDYLVPVESFGNGTFCVPKRLVWPRKSRKHWLRFIRKSR